MIHAYEDLEDVQDFQTYDLVYQDISVISSTYSVIDGMPVPLSAGKKSSVLLVAHILGMTFTVNWMDSDAVSAGVDHLDTSSTEFVSEHGRYLEASIAALHFPNLIKWGLTAV